MANIATMSPPGGRGAPGGSEPPGGREAPGGEGALPRLTIGHRGTPGRRNPTGIGAPRPGTRQTITTRTPDRDRRDALREELQRYRRTRPDLTNQEPGPAPAPGNPPAGGPGGIPNYQAPRRMGQRPPRPRPPRPPRPGPPPGGNPPAGGPPPATPPPPAGPAPSNPSWPSAPSFGPGSSPLGSPGHANPAPAPAASPPPIGAMQGFGSQMSSMNQNQALSNIRAGAAQQGVAATHSPDRPSYGVVPPSIKGETVAAYDKRFQDYFDDYNARMNAAGSGGATP